MQNYDKLKWLAILKNRQKTLYLEVIYTDK